VEVKTSQMLFDKVNIRLSSCPEYWIKHTVYVQQDDGTVKSIPTCKNYFYNNDRLNFVGGSGVNFAKNFNQTGTDLLPDATDDDTTAFTSNVMSNLNNKWIPFTTEEAFTTNQTNELLPGGHQNSDYVKTVSNPNHPNDKRRITYFGNDALKTSDTVTLKQIEGHHVHYTSPDTVVHDNAISDDNLQASQKVHENTTGPSWHSHNYLGNKYNRQDQRDGDFANNWINMIKPDTNNGYNHEGIELNLEKLNSAGNTCELAMNNFQWMEAYNKCNKYRQAPDKPN
jgi:hypothetical protein